MTKNGTWYFRANSGGHVVVEKEYDFYTTVHYLMFIRKYPDGEATRLRLPVPVEVLADDGKPGHPRILSRNIGTMSRTMLAEWMLAYMQEVDTEMPPIWMEMIFELAGEEDTDEPTECEERACQISK